MCKLAQCTYVQTPVPTEIWEMFVWCLQQILYLVPMHFNTTLSSSAHRGAHCVRTSWLHSKLRTAPDAPDQHSVFVAAVLQSHWSALNTRNYLGDLTDKVPEHSQAITKASRLTRVRWMSCSGAVWELRRNVMVPHHAWTTCVITDEGAPPKHDFNCVYWFVIKTTFPTIWLRKVST
jgi:hypothetical protein